MSLEAATSLSYAAAAAAAAAAAGRATHMKDLCYLHVSRTSINN